MARGRAYGQRGLILAQSHEIGPGYNRAMPKDASLVLLGGLTPTAFLRRHWQKRALLVRRALPDFPAPHCRSCRHSAR